MKKILSIIIAIVCLLSFVGCGSKSIAFTFSFSPEIDGVDSIETLVDKIQNDDSLSNKEFYVLAPQKYRTDNGLGMYFKSKSYTHEQKGDITVLMEKFSVCDEETYGKQVTDWGQNGGIAVNFTITIYINTDYCEQINGLKFEYVFSGEWAYNTILNSVNVLTVNIFNENTCFASAIWEGYGYKDEQSSKTCFERCINEYLMTKTEYLEKYANGEFVNSTYEETELKYEENGYYNFGVLVKEIRDSENSNFISIIDGDIIGQFSDCINVYLSSVGNFTVYAKDIVEEIFVEPYLVQSVSIFDNTLSDGVDYGNPPRNYELKLIINNLPDKVESIDKTKITFSWSKSNVVNVLYDGYCFASGYYAYYHQGENSTKKSQEFMRTYTENYIKENIKLV